MLVNRYNRLCVCHTIMRYSRSRKKHAWLQGELFEGEAMEVDAEGWCTIWEKELLFSDDAHHMAKVVEMSQAQRKHAAKAQVHPSFFPPTLSVLLEVHRSVTCCCVVVFAVASLKHQ